MTKIRAKAAWGHRSSTLFQDFQNFQRILTHPLALRYHSDRYKESKRKEMVKTLRSDFSAEDIINSDNDDKFEMDDSKSESSSLSVQSVHSSSSSPVPLVDSDEPSNSKEKTQSCQTKANSGDCK